MKKVIAAITSLVMGGSLAACGKTSSSSETAGSNPGDKTIGIAMPAQNLERWNTDGEFLKNKFEEAGYNVILTYSDNDATKQNNDIVGLVAKDVDLLLIAAVDGKKLSKTLDDAKAKNIPVVSYDRLIMDTDAITYYVSFDNATVGKLQGEYIKEQLQLDDTSGPYNIEFVSGDEADNNARYFFNGAYDTLVNYIDSGKLIVRSGKNTFEKVTTKDWLPENAKKDMEKTLSSNYPAGTLLDAVVCSNDSTALGVAQAIDSVYTGANQPIITGQDGDEDNLRNIVDGKQAMTVYKNLNDEAIATFEVCKTILEGKVPAAGLVDSLPMEVTYDTGSYNNGKKYVQSYLLVPYVITKDNLQLLVETGLYKWNDDGKYLSKVK
ncbi:MAG: sugar ABC transporter substrate-binding protein [Ruminococcus sp.]|nr:sugar ABC transporter substrate-binding protein [Ruminococcus sp.]